MRCKSLIAAAVVAPLAALAIGAAAHADTDLVQNGGFESTTYGTQSSQFGMGYGGQGVTGWTGGLVDGVDGIQMWFYGPNSTTVSAVTQWGNVGQDLDTAETPINNSFVALDGDQGDPAHGVGPVEGSISQTINGLEVGKVYTLTFDWAAAQLQDRSGATTESLQVSMGGNVIGTTPIVGIASQGFSGWMNQSFSFTATGPSELLTFLSIGTPDGLPPVALLDNVSILVPEPASWAMMILGFGAVGFAMRRRNRMVLA